MRLPVALGEDDCEAQGLALCVALLLALVLEEGEVGSVAVLA